MELGDLIGRYGCHDSSKSGYRWLNGPLTVAWKYGLTLVINEFSLAPAPVWVALNDLFEGSPLRLDALGINIVKHPNTRIVVTDNCRALSVNRNYVSRKRQDLTSAERFWHVRAKWPDARQEYGLICKRAQALADHYGFKLDDSFLRIAIAAVRFARLTRKGDVAGVDGLQIPAISTRVLVRFVELAVVKFYTQNETDTVLEEAIKLALATGLSEQQESMLLDLMHLEFVESFKSTHANNELALDVDRIDFEPRRIASDKIDSL